MKAPKVAPVPAPLVLPKPTMDTIKEKKKTELMRLQAGSGRASTIFTDMTKKTPTGDMIKSQKTGG